MTPLRILLTNHTLGDRGGSDLYVRDVATALLARGHRPLVYSPVLGTVAEDLRIATVPVVDDLQAIAEPPDVIHGQHHMETMTALLQFPGVPAVFYCHGWLPWEEAPPLFPRVRRYVAVDEVCRDRLTCQHGIPAGQISLLLNFVDLDRFRPRPPLPARPARALLFCNENGPHVAVVRAACERAGIALDVMGRAFGNASPAPESLLGQYDLVFGRARSALEAAAVGAAVILVSALGLGPMVSARDFERLRRLNLGIRTLSAPLTEAGVLAAIERYDPGDAAEVSRAVRASAGRDAVIDALLAIYAGVLKEPGIPSAADESRAAARYLRSLTAPVKWAQLERAALERRLDAAEGSTHHLREQLAASGGERAEVHAALEQARAAIRDMEASSDLIRAQLAAGSGERAAMQAEIEHARATSHDAEVLTDELRARLAAAGGERAQIHAALEQARGTIGTLEDHLRERLAAAGHERAELHAALEHARATIRNMERSRFWKARAAWVRWRARFTRGS